MPPRLLLRLHRVGAIALTYFAIFYVLVNSAAYPLIAGKTRAAQEAFGPAADAVHEFLLSRCLSIAGGTICAWVSITGVVMVRC
jgi:succinate dehydrogenase/fumarate reductase cytochrome b subunit